MPNEFTKLERQILEQLGPIKHGTPGRPTNRKLALIAQIAAAYAYTVKKQQIKDDSNDPLS